MIGGICIDAHYLHESFDAQAAEAFAGFHSLGEKCGQTAA